MDAPEVVVETRIDLNGIVLESSFGQRHNSGLALRLMTLQCCRSVGLGGKEGGLDSRVQLECMHDH